MRSEIRVDEISLASLLSLFGSDNGSRSERRERGKYQQIDWRVGRL